jgi:hypothetical protein
MCAAYLVALGRWILQHDGDDGAVVVLPTGYATAPELVRVLTALEKSRQMERGNA